ncbi:superoxide dismutase family protein [Actinorugispora endophytica]|uniref:Cu-Zn family superoxide dismutase n=1 Tax=Actinorugispora endophytica TaxID=1605990 RepID=A0A4R6V3K8_9ACTN|nr:superoxide dismutase family protein [Actinorugispora endophytica]TDQ54965.1 Cu-Zn family superoxide dismutase [Actinorugispora endophytica]
MRTTPTVIGIALSALLLTGCENAATNPDGPPEPGPTALPGTAESSGQSLQVSESFAAWSEGATAVTYDEEAVPAESTIQVSVAPAGSATGFTLSVTGLRPDRDYGAHLHTEPCGEDPADSGPHYQNEADPEQPSTDPAYANPRNEVWLDFRTDAEGAASAQTSVTWAPRAGEANSVVIHKEHTQTAAGHAGTAGDRLACVNVPL